MNERDEGDKLTERRREGKRRQINGERKRGMRKAVKDGKETNIKKQEKGREGEVCNNYGNKEEGREETGEGVNGKERGGSEVITHQEKDKRRHPDVKIKRVCK